MLKKRETLYCEELASEKVLASASFGKDLSINGCI
jgi:hypothetical protein